ncbi:MAG: gfo/Idh/MocA family oxidoreductase, partial [Bacteroidota bacterium]
VWGETGGLEWHQQAPNTLVVKNLEGPATYFRTGVGQLTAAATEAQRVPAGHPEGYLEAFANIYKNFAKCVQARLAGTDPDPLHTDFPSVHDGLRGMVFVEKVVENSKSGEKWTKL